MGSGPRFRLVENDDNHKMREKGGHFKHQNYRDKRLPAGFTPTTAEPKSECHLCNGLKRVIRDIEM